MRAHRMAVPALVLAISASAAAQNQVPDAFRSLKPVQVVEVVAAERQALDLTTAQVRRLDSLGLTISEEPQGYQTTPSPGKDHRNVTKAPMISREQAYAGAMGVLTSEQRARANALFGDPGYRLPPEFQTRSGEAGESTDPLQHHDVGAAPAGESTKSADSAKEPLQHHGGKAPSTQADTSGKPTNPVTHKP